jgi:hypothetical protein
MKKSDSEVNCDQRATLKLNQKYGQHSNAQMGSFFPGRAVYLEVKVNPIVVYRFGPLFSQKSREFRISFGPDFNSQGSCLIGFMENLNHTDFWTAAIIADHSCLGFRTDT